MPYAVEPARPHDLGEALDLLRRAELPDNGVARGFGHYLVVRDDAKVVGLCGLEVHGDDGLLRSLVVDQHYRGEGLGSLLVDGVVALAARIGLRAVYLLTATARDYFARRGFSDCAREDAPAGIRDSWEFAVGCPATSAFMKRSVAS